MRFSPRQKILRENRTWLSPLIILMSGFKRLQELSCRAACRLEGGAMFSLTLRDILSRRFEVELGQYSYGSILTGCRVPRCTKIGSYCSIASGVVILRRNHPMDHISQHPLFFNAKVGLVEEDVVFDVTQNPLQIGNDVWIGQNALITSNCRKIGNGAVIAAGAVVTADVPPFAIVAGVPARILRSRVPASVQEHLLRSQWWTHPIDELTGLLPHFLKPLDDVSAGEFVAELKNRGTSKDS